MWAQGQLEFSEYENIFGTNDNDLLKEFGKEYIDALDTSKNNNNDNNCISSSEMFREKSNKCFDTSYRIDEATTDEDIEEMDMDPTPLEKITDAFQSRLSSFSSFHHRRTSSVTSLLRNTSLASVGSAFMESIGTLGTVGPFHPNQFDENEEDTLPSSFDLQETPPELPTAKPFGNASLFGKNSNDKKKPRCSNHGDVPDLLDLSSHTASSYDTAISSIHQGISNSVGSVSAGGKQIARLRETMTRNDSFSSNSSSWSQSSEVYKKITKKKKVEKANRKRKRIRKKDPQIKKPVKKTNLDVLLGRGGCSNHHPGNTAYRKHILGLQPVYKSLGREEKTSFSEDVVNWVHERGGRFLKRDTPDEPWYEVLDTTARAKVSQALREDHTPAGRAAKKAKQRSSKPKKSEKA